MVSRGASSIGCVVFCASIDIISSAPRYVVLEQDVSTAKPTAWGFADERIC